MIALSMLLKLQNKIPFAALLFLTLLLNACAENKINSNEEDGIVEITATHNAEENKHLFSLSNDELSSGWTTFELNNSSAYDHFVLIWKVPEEGIEAAGDSLVDYWAENISQPFQTEFNPYINGDIQFDEFTNNLITSVSGSAPWFFDPGAQTMGGNGFTAAGTMSKTTVHLEPGRYIIECYVKNEEEVFHSAIGMLEDFTVTKDSSAAAQPAPTTRLTISSANGIQVKDELSSGDHVVEIFFEDQITYAHLQGHNVQLVRLDDKDDQELLNELAEWLDWRQAGSLVNRAPDGAEFMGGSMEMAGGNTAYYHVKLEPGDYAWIAEIPNPTDHNMLKTFSITE